MKVLYRGWKVWLVQDNAIKCIYNKTQNFFQVENKNPKEGRKDPPLLKRTLGTWGALNGTGSVQ